MNKYVRVMDGIKSNAGGFEYKLDEINISDNWDISTLQPEKMGGFNFGTEDKILRWLHRGDTIYDVLIPDDAEVILCDEEKGIYRANKIIVTNPRMITDELVLDLYNKTTLSDRIIAQCLVTLLWKNRKEISKRIIKERVNLNNVNEILKEYIQYAGKNNLSSETGKEIYEILKEIASPLDISLYVTKEPYMKKITDDKVINLTGESGSGKSYFSDKYIKDNNYIVIDTDVIFGDKPSDNKESLEIRKLFKNKEKDSLINDFDNCYLEILDYFKDRDKTIVIDSAQYRNMKDCSILKGEVIVMRTSINTCYERVLNRWKSIKKDYTEAEYKKYADRKKGMFTWYKSINKFISKVAKMDLEYKVNNNSFNARASAIIYNKDKTKILLFKIDDRDFYLLPGGKIRFNEDSLSAIKREIKEEIGFDLEYKLYRIEENFLDLDNENIMQYCFCYKAIYEQEIKETQFKCLDHEGQRFYWVDINDMDNIKVFPKINFEYINSNDINHVVNKDIQ